MRRVSGLAITATCCALLAAGCGGERPTVSLVGILGDDARVAVESDGSTLIYYVCGGPQSFATLTTWIRIPQGAGSTFEIDDGDLSVSGDLLTGEGNMTTAGGSFDWSARPVSPDTEEGLYSTEVRGGRIGVVATQPPSGELTVQGVWFNAGDDRAQVDPYWKAVASGLEVVVDFSGDKRAYIVSRFTAPLPPP